MPACRPITITVTPEEYAMVEAVMSLTGVRSKRQLLMAGVKTLARAAIHQERLRMLTAKPKSAAAARKDIRHELRHMESTSAKVFLVFLSRSCKTIGQHYPILSVLDGR
jgi:regulator of PEP synthase PpsR (kinase-PPPase family)